MIGAAVDVRICRKERVEREHTYALTDMFTRGPEQTVRREVERPSVAMDAQRRASLPIARGLTTAAAPQLAAPHRSSFCFTRLPGCSFDVSALLS
jgi:hypothetical protein